MAGKRPESMLIRLVKRLYAEWRFQRDIAILAKLMIDMGYDPKRPETISAVVEKVRRAAYADGRSIREAEANIALLRDLAEHDRRMREVASE